MSIQKITFEGVLNYLATKQGTVWNMVFQASQFDLNDFGDSVSFGHLKLNLSPSATRDMFLDDTHIHFKIRKHGIPQEMRIPYTALMIIQDPDDPSMSMPWPYFLDHGDDIEPEPMTGEQYAIQRMAELGVTITPEQMAAHYAWLHENAPDMFDRNGNLDIIAMASKAHKVSDQPLKPTLQERMDRLGITVIQGGGNKVLSTIPWIDEVYSAKQARRAQLEQLAPSDEFVTELQIHSGGSKGNSVFFPDLDVSKVKWPVKRIARPKWMTVIQGGKQ